MRFVPWILPIVLLVAPLARADDGPVLADLSKVEGIEHFPGDEGAKAHLAREGFVVLPRFHKQIFTSYIGGPLPFYITCDSAHRTYHVLYESAIQAFDRHLALRTRRGLQGLHRRLSEASLDDAPRLAAGRPLALAHVTVALRLLGVEATAPAGLAEEVAAEVALVLAATGTARSPLFDVEETYATYRPRGFYEGSPALERWFRATTWLGRRGFRVANARETVAGLLLASTIAGDEQAREAFQGGADVLGWLLGPADDLTFGEYADAARAATGGSLEPEAIEKSLDAIGKRLDALRDPEINDQHLPPDAWRTFRRETKGLRLLPARRTPDGKLFQVLFEADPERSLPSGLDVGLALGSTRAAAHLRARGERDAAAAETVLAEREAFRKDFGETHYGATLEVAALLFDEASPLHGRGGSIEGTEELPILPAPLFRRDAWQDRLLSTGLASWASLRHAWALHAKRSVCYAGMTDEPPGVVEPAPRYFAGLADLARTLGERLDAYGAFGPTDIDGALTDLLPVLDLLGRGEGIQDEDHPLAEMQQEYAPALNRLYEAQGKRFALDDFFRRVAAAVRAHLEERHDDPDSDLAYALIEEFGALETKANLEGFAKLADRLAEIARREIAGKALTAEDETLIRDYGKTIARLNFWYGNSWLSPWKQMGLVVDVAADPLRGRLLEVAVGAGVEIYVALPLRTGGHRLHVGGAYSYYEFEEAEPLTDSAWRQRVQDRCTPPSPAWTQSFVAAPDVAGIVRRLEAGEQDEAVDHVRDPQIAAALLGALRKAQITDYETSRRVAWIAHRLGHYADGPLRPEILGAYAWWLSRPKAEIAYHESDSWREGITQAYGRALRPADRAHVLSFLLDAPAGANPYLGSRAVEVLLAAREAATHEEIDSLLGHADAYVRRRGLDLLVLQFRRSRRGEADDVARRVARHLATEDNAAAQRRALGYLTDLANDGAGGHTDETHARLAELVSSPNEKVRNKAVEALGTLRALSQAAFLVDLLEKTTQEERLAPLARAVGGALSPDGRQSTLASRAVRAIDALLDTERDLSPRFCWPVQVACLDGLEWIGGDEAVAAVVRIAVDPKRDVDLRDIAVDRLGDMGQAAVPDLFRLCFDETPTGDEADGTAVRLCDVAARALDGILDGAFGAASWPRRVSREALERARIEARKRGYAP